MNLNVESDQYAANIPIPVLASNRKIWIGIFWMTTIPSERISVVCCRHTSLAAKTFFLTKPSTALKLSSTRTGSSEEIKAGWIDR